MLIADPGKSPFANGFAEQTDWPLNARPTSNAPTPPATAALVQLG
ncbi:hypothetical protein [Parafrankia sp. CH37]|nr:hypothetical protein [Parafrankia sp. CH37]